MGRPWLFDSRALALVALLLLSACASHAPAPSPYGVRAAAVAQKMVGVRYRYGGESPNGFDCSGLAYYAYQRAGFTIPRESTDQMRAARRVALKDAAVGDLLFFDTSWNRHHVGIYLGDHRFVHAPTNGKKVSVDRLDEYFLKHLTGVGRFEG